MLGNIIIISYHIKSQWQRKCPTHNKCD